MWQHPTLAELFAAPNAPAPSSVRARLLAAIQSSPPAPPVDARRPATLDGVLDELARLGEVRFSADHGPGANPHYVWRCAVTLRGAVEGELQAGGFCLELAALRCLMEALTAVQRAARHDQRALEALLAQR